MNTQFGVMQYDIPVHRRSLYSKISKVFRRQAVMQTYSCYLIPWANADKVMKSLERFNQDKDGLPLPTRDHLTLKLFKFDSEESGQALIDSAKEALNKLIRDAKINLNNKITALEGETDEEDPLTSARAAAAKCKRTLDDVKALALIFNLTDDMTAALVTFSEYVELQRETIKKNQEVLNKAIKDAVLAKAI